MEVYKKRKITMSKEKEIEIEETQDQQVNTEAPDTEKTENTAETENSGNSDDSESSEKRYSLPLPVRRGTCRSWFSFLTAPRFVIPNTFMRSLPWKVC